MVEYSLIVALGRRGTSETFIPCHQVLLHDRRGNRNMLSIKILIYGHYIQCVVASQFCGEVLNYG